MEPQLAWRLYFPRQTQRHGRNKLVKPRRTYLQRRKVSCQNENEFQTQNSDGTTLQVLYLEPRLAVDGSLRRRTLLDMLPRKTCSNMQALLPVEAQRHRARDQAFLHRRHQRLNRVANERSVFTVLIVRETFPTSKSPLVFVYP